MPTPLPPPPTSGDRTRLAVFIGSGDAGTVNLLKGTGAKATRVTLEWSRVEANFTNPPTYDFYLDSLLAALGAAGISPLVEIRNNPSWASSTNCGPIDKPGGQAAFSRFVQAIVSRYSRAPYNVKQWEFYNEADNRDMVTLGLWLGGCWGDYPAQYASMLQAAYSAVKAADPAAQVLTGGLAHENTASFNMSFIDQILAAGAGNYFDVLNIHYFSSFEFAWSASGVDIIGKVQAVRQKMANYGVSKPVAVTEASWTSTPSNSPNFAAANGEAQSRYVAKLLSRSLSLNLHMVVWFSLADWAGAGYPYGLLNVNNQQRPSYSAFQEASRQFDGAEFVRAVSPGDVGVTGGIEGYAFNAGGRWLWALWATGEPLAVTVPGAASSARNKMGQTIPLAGGGNPTSLQLDDSPIFVRF
ncbi:MAG: hypothetical protein Q7O66_10725 [Dehalococcoidia bacterium]|nr:hypothetical protein [Dehalococcoidia bacterium]